MPSRRKAIVDICGVEYRVEFRSEEQDPFVKNKEGYGDVDKGVLVIHQDYAANPTRARDVLLHEMLHQIANVTGLHHYLETKLKKGVKITEVEEIMIRLLTPALITSLRSAGLLSKKQIKP